MSLLRGAGAAGGAGIAISRLQGRLSALLGSRDTNVAVALTAYGAALGAAAVPIALLAKPDPRLQVPEHMSAAPTFYLTLAGAIAGILIVWPVIRRLPDALGAHMGWLVWLVLGVGYAFLVPFLSGVIIPISIVFLNAHVGIIEFWQIPGQLLNSLFRMPIEAFIYGTLALYTGMIAGALFAVGGFAINEISYSRNMVVHKYVPWAIALTVGLMTIAFAVLAPAELVNKFG